MRCSRKHIHAFHSPDIISPVLEDLKVSHKCNRVAGNIDKFLGIEVYDLVYGLWMDSISWWIYYYKVRFLFQFLNSLEDIIRYEFNIVQVVQLGVLPCHVHCLFNN